MSRCTGTARVRNCKFGPTRPRQACAVTPKRLVRDTANNELPELCHLLRQHSMNCFASFLLFARINSVHEKLRQPGGLCVARVASPEGGRNADASDASVEQCAETGEFVEDRSTCHLTESGTPWFTVSSSHRAGPSVIALSACQVRFGHKIFIPSAVQTREVPAG